MFSTLAAVLVLLVAIGASFVVVHVDAVEPLLATAALLAVIIAVSLRAPS